MDARTRELNPIAKVGEYERKPEPMIDPEIKLFPDPEPVTVTYIKYRRWFAWRPVRVEPDDRLVWLRYVQRHDEDIGWGFVETTYRLPPTP